MSISHRYEITEFYPQPKQVELGEGISELARDVRLTTVNVDPIERKALRLILADADVHVVANKKNYIIDARVESEEDFDVLQQVPPEVRQEYYELTIQGSKIYIRTPHQEGIVWAAQTLSTLFHIMFNGFAVPNLTIRDWPSVPLRGVVSDCNWGNERMERNDWYQAINALSSFKLNALCLGIYNCVPSCRVSDPQMPSEFLLTPVSEEANDYDPRSLSRFRYYNARYDRWYDCEVSPAMFEEDLFKDVLNYGRERGVEIYPYFNLFSSSTLLPTILSDLSARNAQGEPANAGLCLTSASARECLMDFLGKFLRKFYPKGVKYFHIGLAEADDIHAHEEDNGSESPWCECAECQALSKERRLADFLEWLVTQLASLGVEKVVLFSNLLDKIKGFRQELSALLKKPALNGRLVVDFQDLGKETDKKYAATCNPKGFPETWLSPLAGQGNYSNYQEFRAPLEAGLQTAAKQAYQGVMPFFQFDPAYLDHLALLGVRTWEGAEVAGDTTDELRLRWAELIFGGMGKKYINALDQLSRTAADPALQICLPFPYFSLQANQKADKMLPEYPATALAILAKRPQALLELDECSQEAGEAATCFAKLLEIEPFSRTGENADRFYSCVAENLHSLYASARRIVITADYFHALLRIKTTLAKKGAKVEGVLKIAEEASGKLLAGLKEIEAHLPDWLTWLTMQHLGCHKLFLEQLQTQLAKNTSPAKIAWSLPADWEIPEDK